jgi:rhodanese-related sulfurtransferase
MGTAISPRGARPKHRVPLRAKRRDAPCLRRIRFQSTNWFDLSARLSARVLVDVRPQGDFEADPHLIPSSIHCASNKLEDRAKAYGGQSTIVICRDGSSLSQGGAALLRHRGVPAEALEGGLEAWKKERLPFVPFAKLPPVDTQGRTVWVTRARPKIDRIACPWLIRRFVDPRAVFLFVAPSDVVAVAERFGGVPFDIENVFWSHRGDTCTFDTMVEEFGLSIAPLLRLATSVRGADTARPELSPEAPGLLAASLGLSRMYADDLQQLEAGMLLYDAFYRWCRDATEETHNWPTNRPKA